MKNQINKPLFKLNNNLSMLKTYLEVNNSTQIYYKEGDYDNVGSNGYVFNLFKNSKEEEVEYVLKVTERRKDSELEKCVSLLLNEKNLAFFPKFIFIQKITDKNNKYVNMEKYNFHCMSYCGDSLAMLTKAEAIGEEEVLEILFKVIQIYQTLIKHKLYYYDLSLDNVCFYKDSVFLVDVESVRVISSNINTYEIIASFGLSLASSIKEYAIIDEKFYEKLNCFSDLEEMKSYLQNKLPNNEAIKSSDKIFNESSEHNQTLIGTKRKKNFSNELEDEENKKKKQKNDGQGSEERIISDLDEEVEILIIEAPSSKSYQFKYKDFLKSSFNDINLGNFYK